MSAVTDPKTAQPPRRTDEIYRYGWRDVLTRQPDGSIKVTQVPLTLEDVLHPQFGDCIVNGTLHDRVRDYLADVSRARTYHDPGSLVTSDVGIYWDDAALGHHSPDISVIFDVRDRDTPRSSFEVAVEGTRPRLIFEIVSPNTRVNDVETKMVHYHRARVLRYVILDRRTVDSAWDLRGYQYAPDAYQEMAKDDQGRLWLEDLGVWLSTDGQRVLCYDGATNQPIGDYTQLTNSLEETQRRAGAEKARAEAEKARAEAEKARAEAEAQARQTAEQRLREVEAELARLRAQKAD